MTITGPDGAPFPITVEYADILSVSVADTLDPGVCLEGLDTARCRFGSWRSSAYGDYLLCVSPSFQVHIVLETVDGVVAFNYEDAETTRTLCGAIQDLLAEEAPGGSAAPG